MKPWIIFVAAVAAVVPSFADNMVLPATCGATGCLGSLVEIQQILASSDFTGVAGPNSVASGNFTTPFVYGPTSGRDFVPDLHIPANSVSITGSTLTIEGAGIYTRQLGVRAVVGVAVISSPQIMA